MKKAHPATQQYSAKSLKPHAKASMREQMQSSSQTTQKASSPALSQKKSSAQEKEKGFPSSFTQSQATLAAMKTLPSSPPTAGRLMKLSGILATKGLKAMNGENSS